MDRRSFLRGLAGATAAVLAPAVKFVPALEGPVTRLQAYAFAEIVWNTLDACRDQIAANVAQNNAFLKYLKDRNPS